VLAVRCVLVRVQGVGGVESVIFAAGLLATKRQLTLM